jgi:predicted DCC family thiol-disulfide oxidoreductase YuxK
LQVGWKTSRFRTSLGPVYYTIMYTLPANKDKRGKGHPGDVPPPNTGSGFRPNRQPPCHLRFSSTNLQQALPAPCYKYAMPEYYLIYDDACPLCQGAVKRVTRMDTMKIVHLVPLSRPKLPKHLHLPLKEDLEQEIHLIDTEGKILKGADALAKLARLFPKTRMIGKMLQLPGFKQSARPMYRLVAKSRKRTL